MTLIALKEKYIESLRLSYPTVKYARGDLWFVIEYVRTYEERLTAGQPNFNAINSMINKINKEAPKARVAIAAIEKKVKSDANFQDARMLPRTRLASYRIAEETAQHLNYRTK